MRSAHPVKSLRSFPSRSMTAPGISPTRAPKAARRRRHGGRFSLNIGGPRGREERYLIVACTAISDVPEAVGPCPVALMAKVSLPLYLAFAVYS